MLPKLILIMAIQNQEKYFGALYDASIVQKKLENSAKDEGRKQRMKQGIKKGIEQRLKQTAKAMLKENIDIELISKCTGLSIEEINELK